MNIHSSELFSYWPKAYVEFSLYFKEHSI